jgi:hypothetical protein
MKGCFLGLLLGPIITEIGLLGWAMYEQSKTSGETTVSGVPLVAIFAWIPGLILGPIVGAILGRIW